MGAVPKSCRRSAAFGALGARARAASRLNGSVPIGIPSTFAVQSSTATAAAIAAGALLIFCRVSSSLFCFMMSQLVRRPRELPLRLAALIRQASVNCHPQQLGWFPLELGG